MCVKINNKTFGGPLCSPSTHSIFCTVTVRRFLITPEAHTLSCDALGTNINAIFPPWELQLNCVPPLTVTTFIFCIFPYLSTLVHSLCKYYPFALLLCLWLASVLSLACICSRLSSPTSWWKQLKEQTLSVVNSLFFGHERRVTQRSSSKMAALLCLETRSIQQRPGCWKSCGVSFHSDVTLILSSFSAGMLSWISGG